MSDTEQTFLKAFVIPERQSRYLGLIKTEKGRQKLRMQLAHFRDLDPRFAHKLSSAQQNTEFVLRHLVQNGAGNSCWVLSENSQLDGKEFSLEEAIERVLGYNMGTFVICIPDRLAFYEGEEPSERYVLKKPAQAVSAAV